MTLFETTSPAVEIFLGHHSCLPGCVIELQSDAVKSYGLCPARETLCKDAKKLASTRLAAAGLVDNEYAAALQENLFNASTCGTSARITSQLDARLQLCASAICSTSKCCSSLLTQRDAL